LLKIRETDETDCKLLWEWANDPEVRAFSFHSEAIPWENHVTWFSKKMADPNCHLYVILNENSTAIGQVRFDIQRKGEAIVSISIAKDKRGHGYGTEALKLALKELVKSVPELRQVKAYVKIANTSSIRIFQRAGFAKEGKLMVENQAALQFRWTRDVMDGSA
jgi:UDP-2,4-diacetamido-2,4,6-trideoxy-beta-L-altropyranose hydrolase